MGFAKGSYSAHIESLRTSYIHKGKSVSKETIQKCRDIWTPKKRKEFSERMKIIKADKVGVPLTEQHKANISKGIKAAWTPKRRREQAARGKIRMTKLFATNLKAFNFIFPEHKFIGIHKLYNGYLNQMSYNPGRLRKLREAALKTRHGVTT